MLYPGWGGWYAITSTESTSSTKTMCCARRQRQARGGAQRGAPVTQICFRAGPVSLLSHIKPHYLRASLVKWIASSSSGCHTYAATRGASRYRAAAAGKRGSGTAWGGGSSSGSGRRRPGARSSTAGSAHAQRVLHRVTRGSRSEQAQRLQSRKRCGKPSHFITMTCNPPLAWRSRTRHPGRPGGTVLISWTECSK
jgi:hypothetical protein